MQIHWKWRWQFGLRTLLIVITLATFPCAWACYSLNWIKDRSRALAGDGVWGYATLRRIQHAPMHLWLFGEEGVETIMCRSGGEQRKGRLAQLFPEATIVESETSPFP
jgi:hypothetical protein